MIHTVLESLGAATSRVAIDLGSAGSLDGAKITLYLAGTWTTNINNPFSRVYQMRVPRTTEIGPATTTPLVRTSLITDPNVRWQRTVDGTTSWGPGSATLDTTLSRSAVGILQSNGGFGFSGLTGATVGGRIVGATASGAPTSGTFAVGDVVIARDGVEWICVTAGTPGTWAAQGQPPLVSGQYYFVASQDGFTTGSPAINAPRSLFRRFDRSVSIATIGCVFTAAGSSDSVARLAVWADDGAGRPANAVPLLDAGTISTGTGNAGNVATGGTPGSYEITLGASLILPIGNYHFAVVSQGTTPATFETVTQISQQSLALGTSKPGASTTVRGYGGVTQAGALVAWGTTYTPVTTIVRTFFKVL